MTGFRNIEEDEMDKIVRVNSDEYEIGLKHLSLYRQGKNWYVRINSCVITVNASSYTIITAHKEKS